MEEGCNSSAKHAMNYGWCLSYQHDSFQLKQDQALGFIGPMQI